MISFKKELLVDLFKSSKKYNSGKGFCARSIITHEIGAVCYLVWDNNTA